MAEFTFEEYADMHLMYGLSSGNSLEARRLYSERFPNRVLPDRRTFTRVDRRLRETGSVLPKKGGEGGRRNVCTVVVEQNVLDTVGNNPTTSVRKLSAQLNVSKSSVHKILKEQLLHPFHIQKVHAITEQDYPARLEYCNWFLNKQQENDTFIGKVLFTDEAGFTRDGVINSHNLHSWDEENPHATIQTKNQHRFIVNVWAGIVGNHLIGPYVFDNTVNGERYLQFLQNDFVPLLDDVPIDIRRNLWYMHDGAPPHFSVHVRNYLDTTFHNKWIGRGGPIRWPSRAPDLNPLDFFFWGFLKNLVYATPVQTRDELLERIHFHCNTIRNNANMLFQVQRNNILRLRKCVDVNGGHIEHLM